MKIDSSNFKLLFQFSANYNINIFICVSNYDISLDNFKTETLNKNKNNIMYIPRRKSSIWSNFHLWQTFSINSTYVMNNRNTPYDIKVIIMPTCILKVIMPRCIIEIILMYSIYFMIQLKLILGSTIRFGYYLFADLDVN